MCDQTIDCVESLYYMCYIVNEIPQNLQKIESANSGKTRIEWKFRDSTNLINDNRFNPAFYVLLTLWQHPGLLHKRWQVQTILMTYILVKTSGKRETFWENSIAVNDFVAKKSTLFKTMFVPAGTRGCARFPEIL